MTRSKAWRKVNGQRLTRDMFIERLEDRTLLASDWQNAVNRLDVDESGLVTPLDALVVFNALQGDGGHQLNAIGPGSAPPPYLDVNGNGWVDPLDALPVINYLNISLPAGYSFQKFHVDVTTGEVDVGPLRVNSVDGSEGESRFIGSTVVFNSSQLLDEPGNTGRKILNVSLTNHSGQTLGKLLSGEVTGLRVLFSPFTNVGAFSDLRPTTQVANVAGTGTASSIDGSTIGIATLSGPSGVAVDGSGNIYVTEANGNRVRKISNGFVSTLAGSGVAGTTDGVGTVATFNNPWGIARNPIDGALIVTDFAGQKVRRIDVDGRVTTIAGTGALGDANGTGDVATFRNPAGVVVDSNGFIYIAESGGHRVRKIVKTAGADARLASSYNVSVLAGSTATPPVAGFVDGNGANARFNTPQGVAVDSKGNVYVADRINSRIRRVSPTGEVVTIGGTGVAGDTDGPGNVATFNLPRGITAVDDSTLLVTDTGSQKVRQLTLRPGKAPASATSWQVATIAGNGVAGAANGTGDVASFNAPRAIAVDSSHNAYVADFSSNKIRRVTPTNGFFPLGNATGSVPAEPIRLSNADGVIPLQAIGEPYMGNQPFVKYAGELADNATTATQSWALIVPNFVAAFEFTVVVEANTSFLAPPFAVSNPGPSGVGSPNNFVRTVAGTDLPGFVDGVATEARFNGLNGIAVDKAGNRYVADTVNHSIRRITPDGFVSTVAGTGGSSGSVDGNGSAAKFLGPSGVAVTADGKTLYVTDSSNNTIRRIHLSDDADPKLPQSWIVNTIAGLAGAAAYVDNTTGNSARFSFPLGIAVSEGGNVYVSEFLGNRVRLLQQRGDPSLATSWRVSLLAGSTLPPNGIAGASDGNGSVARFSNPAHIAVDQAGNVYVADSGNHRIRRISPNQDVFTVAGLFTGYADGNGMLASFSTPVGIAVDSSGYVYVTDGGHRIRRISPAGVVTTVAGTGTSSPGDIDGTGAEATFFVPRGIAVDLAGSLHVVSGATYPFGPEGPTDTIGLKIRLIERIIAIGSE